MSAKCTGSKQKYPTRRVFQKLLSIRLRTTTYDIYRSIYDSEYDYTQYLQKRSKSIIQEIV